MERPDTEKPEKRVEAEITVRSSDSQRVQLELYRLNDRPKFKVVAEPNIGTSFSHNESMLTDGTVYYPIFHLHNHSGKSVKVTVWWVGGGERVRYGQLS
jgi:hypothetical protein